MHAIISVDIDQFLIESLTIYNKYHAIVVSGTAIEISNESIPVEIYNIINLNRLRIYVPYIMSCNIINFKNLESLYIKVPRKLHNNLQKLPKLSIYEIGIYAIDHIYSRKKYDPEFANKLTLFINRYN